MAIACSKLCFQHLQSKQMVHYSEHMQFYNANRAKFVFLKNSALQGSTAQIIAEIDGYDACEWISDRPLGSVGKAKAGYSRLTWTAWVQFPPFPWVAMTQGARQAAMEAHAAGVDPDDLPHAMFNGRALGVGGTPEPDYSL